MKVSKMVVINIGNYQSLRLGVDECPNYAIADNIIIQELQRIGLPVDQKVKQVLLYENSELTGETKK
jgi:hypothetical protein